MGMEDVVRLPQLLRVEEESEDMFSDSEAGGKGKRRWSWGR